MKKTNKIIMTLVGLLLITAAVLKAHQILTTVIPDFEEIRQKYTGFEFFMRALECREMMIFHVPLEIGLGIWMISGLFRRAGWMLAIATFIFFSFVTAYKAVNGYADCGCFGVAKIDPKITLFIVDLPSVLLLLIFRPIGTSLFKPWPSGKHFLAVAIPTAIILPAITATLLISPAVKSEPLEQTGQMWDKLEHISASEKLSSGMWVVMLYHNDCPNCIEAVPGYKKMAAEFKDNINFAFIEVPSKKEYKYSIVSDDGPWLHDRLDESRNWMIQTPRVILLVDGQVIKVWQVKAPDINEILSASE